MLSRGNAIGLRIASRVRSRSSSGQYTRPVLTQRTLQRRLKDLDISVLVLRAQVRMETARRMLVDSRLPVTRIAEQLGFSEPSAFTRAFRSYARQSPRAFRQAALAPV